ncbi:MAG: acyl-CoA thioesterase [Treponemataceae bacterium]|nr:acyl-CoA thioesterase [Treponemataceae bacterium]
MKGGLISAEAEFTVEFYDVDSMEVVWHGNYVKYMEMARCVLLDKIGFGYKEMVRHGYAFPVTNISVKYVRPLLFGERARIKAFLVEYENRLRITYEIYNSAGELTTKAESSQLAVRMDTKASLFECPPVLIQRVEALLSRA